MRKWLRATGFVFGVFISSAIFASVGADAAAQQPQGNDTRPAAEARSTEFRGVRGPQAERVPGGPLLIAAYGVVFFSLLLFIVRVGVLQAQSRRDLERLEKALSKPKVG